MKTNNNNSVNNRIVKAYEYICHDCSHTWLSKKEDQYCCPECKSVYLDIEKLR